MPESQKPFKKIAILGGGGVMGHGIALACLARSDAHVTLISRKQETIDHGFGLIEDGPFGLQKALSRGKLTEDQIGNMRGRLDGTIDLAAGLSGVDLIFESVAEILDTKQTLLAEAERVSPDDVIIATNTSSFMISELAGKLENPSRLVGTHWFYPSNIMPLVEVARSALVKPQTLDRVVAFLKELGKKPVVVNDSPGFFMTRFINNYLAEAIRLVELGICGPAEVDEMVKTGLGWPMGVFELLDDSSFDAFYHAQHYLFETCGERYAVPPLARKVYTSGYQGAPDMKPGSRGGWYDFMGVDRKPANDR